MHFYIDSLFLCRSAFILAETGLLNGKSCATHWAVHQQFEKKYKDFDKTENWDVVNYIKESLPKKAADISDEDLAKLHKELLKQHDEKFLETFMLEYALLCESLIDYTLCIAGLGQTGYDVNKIEAKLSKHVNKIQTLSESPVVWGVALKTLTQANNPRAEEMMQRFVKKWAMMKDLKRQKPFAPQ